MELLSNQKPNLASHHAYTSAQTATEYLVEQLGFVVTGLLLIVAVGMERQLLVEFRLICVSHFVGYSYQI